MPNWTSNDLTITAKSKKAIPDLSKFKEVALTVDNKGQDLLLDFEKFVPYPKEVYEDKDEQVEIEKLKREGKEGEAKKLEILFKLKEHKEFNWYDFNVTNWGTKWNANINIEPVLEGNKLFYTFNTAWSPPLLVIVAMSLQFPNLYFKLKYYEGAMGFKGVVECKNGKVIKETYSENYYGGRGG